MSQGVDTRLCLPKTAWPPTYRRYEQSQLMKFRNKRENKRITIAYCRVSSSDQKNDLKRQIERVSDFCIAKGYSFRVIQDIGSGLNYEKRD